MISVGEVVKHVELSRRSLELRFQKAIGRTIHAELQRVRFERAKRLLRESELPVAKVSDNAGYGTPSYMGQVFKEQLDMTPAQFRRHLRGESWSGNSGDRGSDRDPDTA